MGGPFGNTRLSCRCIPHFLWERQAGPGTSGGPYSPMHSRRIHAVVQVAACKIALAAKMAFADLIVIRSRVCWREMSQTVAWAWYRSHLRKVALQGRRISSSARYPGRLQDMLCFSERKKIAWKSSIPQRSDGLTRIVSN